MADVGQVGTDIRGELGPDRRRIAELAARQHGVVARWQLYEMGFKSGAIDRMIAAGYLHSLHRGVYAVGHRMVSRSGRVMAVCSPTDHRPSLATSQVPGHGTCSAGPGIRSM
jgi:hypothetical protein